MVLHKTHPLFVKFESPYTTKLILENSKHLEIKKGGTAFKTGDKKLSFFIILTGWVKVAKDDGVNMNMQSLGEFGCGTIVGEEWLYSKAH